MTMIDRERLVAAIEKERGEAIAESETYAVNDGNTLSDAAEDWADAMARVLVIIGQQPVVKA